MVLGVAAGPADAFAMEEIMGGLSRIRTHDYRKGIPAATMQPGRGRSFLLVVGEFTLYRIGLAGEQPKRVVRVIEGFGQELAGRIETLLDRALPAGVSFR
jgi:hypothetical protein